MFRENDREMKAVLVLSAGPCDAIERVWAHGDEVEMERNGNVLTPVSGSKYYGTEEVTYEEEYFEETPPDREGGPDGPEFTPDPPDVPQPGDPEFVGPIRPPSRPPPETQPPGGEGGGYCGACRGGGGPGPGGSCAPPGFRITDGFEDWMGATPPQWHMFGRSLDLSPWAIRRYAESAGTAGAMASAGGGGVSGQQGEGGGETFEEMQARIERERAAARDGSSRVRRTRTRTRTVTRPLIKITEFFNATGQDGQAVADILGPAGEGELEWNAEFAGNDVSYVVLELYQPDYGNEIDDRFWPAIPQMEFLLRGLKVSYPIADSNAPNGRRLTAPAWTRNAAILRYWYLTARRDVDPLLIDIDYFTRARLLCDENLQLTTQTGYRSDYPESVKRYTIDGSVTSGDSAAQLDVQFDFAWQGFVVESSGNLLFRPGTDEVSRFTITEDDIIGEPTVSPFGARSDLANELSLEIEQSSGSEWKAENFVVVDSVAQESDGERLPQELSQMKFVTEPVQAVNLLTQRLRQQRGLVGLELHVKSPNDWRYHRLIAGDKIEVQLPEHGIGQTDSDGNPIGTLRYFRVTGVQVNDDYSVNLHLLEWPDNLFNDEVDFPLRQEKFSYQRRAIPAPIGTGYIDWNINRAGSVIWPSVLSGDSSAD